MQRFGTLSSVQLKSRFPASDFENVGNQRAWIQTLWTNFLKRRSQHEKIVERYCVHTVHIIICFAKHRVVDFQQRCDRFLSICQLYFNAPLKRYIPTRSVSTFFIADSFTCLLPVIRYSFFVVTRQLIHSPWEPCSRLNRRILTRFPVLTLWTWEAF